MQPLLSDDPLHVGPYRIIGRLGAGGMAAVYAGLSVDGERVAVKVVHLELAHDPEFRSRFAREIALMGRIRGACTVRVLAADSGAARPWLATEYVPGQTLDQRIRTAGPLAGNELYGLASGLAEALVAIHAAGVLHRDLKPSNVVLSPSGPRVLDLGIARALDEASVTRTGVLLGSPAWISPEHYRNEHVGPASDIYAWGLLITFSVTGQYPYGVGRPEVLAMRVLNDEVDLSGVPEELRSLVAATLSKQPDERPSAIDVLDAVTTTWRDRLGVPSVGPVDADAVTALIERTWVMPAVDDLAWASVSPALKRKRRSIPVLMVAGALAVATALYVSSGGSNRGSRNLAGDQTLARSPSPADVTPPPLDGRRVALAGDVSVIVPAGWTLSGGDGGVGQQFCLLSPSHAQDGCVNYGVSFETWEDPDEADIDDPYIWEGDTGALPQCFGHGDFDKGPGITSTISARGSRPLGDRTAIYREYTVTCGSLASFNPRVWWLPTTRLMMTVVALSPSYRQTVDQIAASVLYR
jgi:eukaryotic-like serine/threonine-protein kinase